jgi:hypothetical protein
MSPLEKYTNGIRIRYVRDKQSPWSLSWRYDTQNKNYTNRYRVRSKVFTTQEEALEWHDQILVLGKWPTDDPIRFQNL